jgi:selenide,water dikinase
MSDPLRLTQLTGQGGCSAKIAQADLQAVLGGIATPAGGSLLVSASTMDDAAVYRLGEGLALVATTDFFPPPVDDPHAYGAIATANALSDVYAMGGVPLLLLNLVGYDLANLDGAVLRRILEGGAEVAAEAGCAIAGGHSIRSAEPLFGCAVVGRVDPERMVTNAGARPQDVVFLTKPLGTGVILNAHKRNQVDPGVLAGATSVMRQLNRAAAEAMLEVGATAATDVTGFGLMGHAHNLARASAVGLRLHADRLPALPGALKLIRSGLVPGGSRRNMELAHNQAAISKRVAAELVLLACDAQTSGGLLVTVPATRAADFAARVPGADRIGEVVAAAGGAPAVELV